MVFYITCLKLVNTSFLDTLPFKGGRKVSWKEMNSQQQGRVVMKTAEKMVLVKQIVLFTIVATILGFIYG